MNNRVYAPREKYMEWIQKCMGRAGISAFALKGLNLWMVQFKVPQADVNNIITRDIPRIIQGINSPKYKAMMQYTLQEMVSEVEFEWARECKSSPPQSSSGLLVAQMKPNKPPRPAKTNKPAPMPAQPQSDPEYEDTMKLRNRCVAFLVDWLDPKQPVAAGNLMYWNIHEKIAELQSWLYASQAWKAPHDEAVEIILQMCNMVRSGVDPEFHDDFAVVIEGMLDVAEAAA